LAGDGFEHDWADKTAKVTILFTTIGVVLFVGAVFLFIL
jgi:hypothetical protein